jgi:putative acetyltransferase
MAAMTLPDHQISSLIIRPFQEADQTGVRALILAGLAERWGSLDPALNDDLDDIAATFADGCFLVACLGREIVGCGGLLTVAERRGQIVRMSTAVAWRRRGIASQLLRALEAEAQRLRLTELMLETTSSWHSARQFYRRQGYTHTHDAAGDSYYTKRLG